MPHSRLHRRFLWPLVATILVGTTLAWLVAALLYSGAAERHLSRQLGHAAAVLADGALPLTPTMLDLLARLLQADIALLTPTGQVALASDGSAPAFVDLLARVPAANLLTDPQGPGGAGAGTALVVAAPIAAERDPRYALIALRADLGELRRAARDTALWLGVAASLGLLVLSLVLHRIGLSITSPVRALAAMAEAIAEGDRAVRAPMGRADELGALAQTLNRMAERLDHYEREQARQGRLAALGEIAARIAHEIRNPLTALKLNGQLLAEGLPAAQRPLAATLIEELDRLELIVASVLTQAQGAPATLNRRPTDLDALIAGTLRLFHHQFTHNGIRLEAHLGAAALLPDLDPERFKQVLVNLLVNARDALPDGGNVRVTTGPQAGGAGIRVLVEDSGPGLAGGAAGDSTKALGLGLGLKLCRELIAAHGGSLTLGPGALGGLRATIDLPLPETGL